MYKICKIHFWTFWNTISWVTSLFDVIFSWLFVTKTIRHEMSRQWFVTFCVITGIAVFFVLFELFSLIKEALKKYREHYGNDSVNDEGHLIQEENEEEKDDDDDREHIHWPSVIGSLFQDFVLVVALYFVKDETKCEINVEAYEEELAASKTRRFFEAMFAGITMINAAMNFVSLLSVTLSRFWKQRDEEGCWQGFRSCWILPGLVLSCLLFLASVFLALIALLTNVTGAPSVLPPQFGIQFRSNWSYAAVYYSWPHELRVANVTLEGKRILFNHTTITMTRLDTAYSGQTAKFIDTKIWKWPKGPFNFSHFSFEQDMPCSHVISPQILKAMEYNFSMHNITNCTLLVGGWWTNTNGSGLELFIKYGYQISNGTQCRCGNFTGGKVVEVDLKWTNDSWHNGTDSICSRQSCADNCQVSNFSAPERPQIFCLKGNLGFCRDNVTRTQNLELKVGTKRNVSYGTQDPCICSCDLSSGKQCLVETKNGEEGCKVVRTGPIMDESTNLSLLHRELLCPIQSNCGSEALRKPDFPGTFEAKNQWLLELRPFVRCGRKEPKPEVKEDRSIKLKCGC